MCSRGFSIELRLAGFRVFVFDKANKFRKSKRLLITSSTYKSVFFADARKG